MSPSGLGAELKSKSCGGPNARAYFVMLLDVVREAFKTFASRWDPTGTLARNLANTGPLERGDSPREDRHPRRHCAVVRQRIHAPRIPAAGGWSADDDRCAGRQRPRCSSEPKSASSVVPRALGKAKKATACGKQRKCFAVRRPDLLKRVAGSKSLFGAARRPRGGFAQHFEF